MKKSWRYPFCGHNAIVHNGVEGTVSEFQHLFLHRNKFGDQYIQGTVVVCPNEQCREYEFVLSLGNLKFDRAGNHEYTQTRNWRLIPDSTAKVYPSYIPKPLLDDYREACQIRDLSPKASATLSRRCLQGMIRDFWGVSKQRLVDEIDAIQDKLDVGVWEAIDAVRRVGNIGAHMEQDISFIIDVEPDEAQLLIGLVETLVEEWYVARHERQERMEKVKALAVTKDQQRKSAAK